MSRMATICALLLTFVGPDTLAQNSWLFAQPIDGGRQFPKMVRGVDNNLILTLANRSNTRATIQVFVSSDEGFSWSNAGTVAEVAYNTLGLQRQPTTIATADGTLHCLWEDARKDVGRIGIFYARSTNSGETWTDPILIHRDLNGYNQDFSSIAAHGNSLYATFLSPDPDRPDGQIHVMLCRSSDGGLTWESPIRVDNFETGGACECCIQNVAVASDGTIAVAFRSNINNQRDIWVAKSFDGGESFETPILVQDSPWTIFGCPSTGPSIAFDAEDNLHCVWRDSRDSVQRNVVYYSRLDKGAQGGSKNVDLSSSLAMTAEYAAISVSPDGENVFVVLETSRGLMTSESTNGGESFDGNELDPLVQRNASPFSVWSSTRGHFYGWQATRGETFDVTYGATITSVDEENSNEDVLLIQTGDGINVLSEQDIKTVTVYDLMGRLIARTTGGVNTLSVSVNMFTSRAVLLVHVALSDGRDVSRVINIGR